MDIRQCKKCKKLFQFNKSALCPKCEHEMDLKFAEVRDYIYENHNAGIDDVCEATGVEPGIIYKWLSEGRLIITKGSNPLLKCEKCGAPIYTGKLCDTCNFALRTTLKSASEKLKPAQNAPPPQRLKEKDKMHLDIIKK